MEQSLLTKDRYERQPLTSIVRDPFVMMSLNVGPVICVKNKEGKEKLEDQKPYGKSYENLNLNCKGNQAPYAKDHDRGKGFLL